MPWNFQGSQDTPHINPGPQPRNIESDQAANRPSPPGRSHDVWYLAYIPPWHVKTTNSKFPPNPGAEEDTWPDYVHATQKVPPDPMSQAQRGRERGPWGELEYVLVILDRTLAESISFKSTPTRARLRSELVDRKLPEIWGIGRRQATPNERRERGQSNPMTRPNATGMKSVIPDRYTRISPATHHLCALGGTERQSDSDSKMGSTPTRAPLPHGFVCTLYTIECRGRRRNGVCRC
ncbi:hypothetical protein BO71DRAFT_65054 [Aspergillus ellipticus CBS 707.79]|uniref:Uncharacterized protein n=1 Tax=Aspergillus ellipticus CBS 707.79 TaxID=1448320 RepID=A0A319EC16_9EURO|nr:hypothetical protein BO71DRAFT_65054 [Aspergillus ellipticus CBS 707.79]